MRIAVGSTNPAKIKAVHQAFHDLGYRAEIIPLNVPSGVSPQPFSDEETIQGAVNRAQNALVHPSGRQPFDYGIGLEGGVKKTPHGLFLCNWGAVACRSGTVGIGGGLQIRLPDFLAAEVAKGKELGDVIEAWSGRTGVRSREGAIGMLTHNRITRMSMFRDTVICAFSRFMNRAD